MRALIAAAALLLSAPVAAQSDQLLYRFVDVHIRNGQFGAIAPFQRALFPKAAACGLSEAGAFAADGVFGGDTKRAISAVARCPAHAAAIPLGSPARGGAITEAIWRVVMNDVALPGPAQRALDLTLVFEGTDYTALEFNFCQSRSPQTLRTWLQGDPSCYSNDPCSFATWGPRGATAGHGHELQAVLFDVARTSPATLPAAFGAESGEVERLLRADARSAELLLCAAFASPDRHAAWKSGFEKIGRDASVRTAYDRIYKASDKDGGKIATLLNLYAELKPTIGRDPTEIDFAFFLDRATHGGTPRASAIPDLRDSLAVWFKSAATSPSPAQLRWALAARVPVSNQQADRQGRDVVYVIDGMGDAVGAQAFANWKARGPLRASDFGLSDSRPAPSFDPGPQTPYSSQPRSDVSTDADRRACPAIMLRPLHPRDGQPRTCN